MRGGDPSSPPHGRLRAGMWWHLGYRRQLGPDRQVGACSDGARAHQASGAGPGRPRRRPSARAAGRRTCEAGREAQVDHPCARRDAARLGATSPSASQGWRTVPLRGGPDLHLPGLPRYLRGAGGIMQRDLDLCCQRGVPRGEGHRQLGLPASRGAGRRVRTGCVLPERSRLRLGERRRLPLPADLPGGQGLCAGQLPPRDGRLQLLHGALTPR